MTEVDNKIQADMREKRFPQLLPPSCNTSHPKDALSKLLLTAYGFYGWKYEQRHSAITTLIVVGVSTTVEPGRVKLVFVGCISGLYAELKLDGRTLYKGEVIYENYNATWIVTFSITIINLNQKLYIKVYNSMGFARFILSDQETDKEGDQQNKDHLFCLKKIPFLLDFPLFWKFRKIVEYMLNSLHSHTVISTEPNLRDGEDEHILFYFINCSPTEFIIWCLTVMISWDRTELFSHVMQFSSYVEKELSIDSEWWLPHLRNKQRGQHAYAVALMKNGEVEDITKQVIKPRRSKDKNGIPIHSEEIVINDLNLFLQNKGHLVECIFIYTLNSPCLKRECNNDCCSLKLLKWANQWCRKYGISTAVGFTNYWGMSGPNFFHFLRYSDVSCPSSVYFSYCDKFQEFRKDHLFWLKRIPFLLDFPLFWKFWKNVEYMLNSLHSHTVISTEPNLRDGEDEHILLNHSPTEFIIQVLTVMISWDRTELFSHVMQFSSYVEKELSIDSVCVKEWWLPHLRNKQHGQHAFAVALMKNGEVENITKQVIKPCQSKDKKEIPIHSEEIVINGINLFLQNKGHLVERIFIYTLNSPCLKRECNYDCCSLKLLKWANQWCRKYGISTAVGFTNYWGMSGSNFFHFLRYSDVSCPSSVYFSYCEKFKDKPFKLHHKELSKYVGKSQIYRTLLDVHKKQKQRKGKDKEHTISSALDHLLKDASKSPSSLREEHLKHGREEISKFKFDPQFHDEICETLINGWDEMVDNSAMTPIRTQITSDFNTAVVKFFQLILKNNSSFQLYHIPENMLN